MAKVSDVLDRFQRRVPAVSMPLATIYKFFEDQGNYLAAIVTYYAFIAIFPLLLLGSSILGFVLEGSPGLQETILNSALSQFPIVGEQLGRPEGLQGSVTAIVIGALAALYGATGLGQASQNAMNIAWAVPRNSRPNPFLGRLRSLLLLVTSGVAVLAITIVSAIGSSTQVFGADLNDTLQWVVRLLTIAIVALVFTLLFRLAAARDHRFWRAAPGAVAVAVMWQALQWIGTVYVTRVINETSALTQTFGTVLGMIGFIYIAAVMVVLGIEVNVVLAKRLYPRALLTPFTDSVDLTDADRRAYAEYAKMQRHKGFESVTVTFSPRERAEPHDAESHEDQAPGDDGLDDGTAPDGTRTPHLVAMPDPPDDDEPAPSEGPERTVPLPRDA